MKQLATVSNSTTLGVLAQRAGQKLLLKYLRKKYCEEQHTYAQVVADSNNKQINS